MYLLLLNSGKLYQLIPHLYREESKIIVTKIIHVFRKSVSISEPYKCLNCKGRFRLKAHAANHRKQSSKRRCREMGFVVVEQSGNENLSAYPALALPEQEDEDVPEEKQHVCPSECGNAKEELTDIN